MTFQEAYQKAKSTLNPEQLQAVETIYGPVLAIAGPGTGKTQVLALRIAEILKQTDTEPHQILALTFTEAGVIAMRNRLRSIIGPEAHAVHITTFHGFCSEIISRFPEKFLFSARLDTADDLTKIQILKDILESGKFTHLTPFTAPNLFLKDILSKISVLKREGFSPEEFLEVVEKAKEEFEEISDEEKINTRTGKMKGKYQDQKKRGEKWEELFQIYEKYQSALKKQGLMDFDDQILFVLKAFREDEDLLFALREQYLFLLGDEFQDSNGAQMEILEKLCEDESPNIFVVGDDDQSIYRFQGANLENVHRFLQKYKGAKYISLTKNYRSTQQILDIAESSISHGNERLTKMLPDLQKNIVSGIGKTGEKPKLYEFSSAEAEQYFVFQKIREIVGESYGSHLQFSDIAILVRTNNEGREMMHYLQKNDIPSIFPAKSNVLQDIRVRQFLQLLKLIQNPEDNTLFFEVLHIPIWEISPPEVWKAWREVKKERGKFFTMFNEKITNDELRITNEHKEKKDVETLQCNVFVSEKSEQETQKMEHVGASLCACPKEETLEQPPLPKSPYEEEKPNLFSETEKPEKICNKNDFVGGSYSCHLQNLVKNLLKWNADLRNLSFPEFFQKVLTESKFLDFLLQEKTRFETLNHFNSLFSEVKTLARGNPKFSLKDFLHVLEIREEFDVPIKDRMLKSSEDAVQILTTHGSKGLEYEVVFVTNLASGVWGDKRNIDKIPLPEGLISLPYSPEHANEEERRLFFVAITRAKSKLFLSSPGVSLNGRKQSPSRFLDEIDEGFYEKGDSKEYEENVFERLKSDLIFASKKTIPEEDFVRDLISPDTFALSPTAFENYRQCPRKFFYENLLRIPGVKDRTASLGTALHSALEHYFLQFSKTKEKPNFSYALSVFQNHLQEKEILSEKDLQDSLTEGKELLKKYFSFYEEGFVPPMQTELDFRSHRVFLNGEVPITGKIDKVEWISEAEKTVRIIDYKTTKPKSENVIRGLTASQKNDLHAGSMFRQLIFYSLLAEESTRFSCRAESFQLDFLRPENDKFVRREFMISHQEREELKEQVLEVWEDISNLHFMNADEECETAKKNRGECEWCELFRGA